MSCVHYKYKNSLEYDTITFEGLHISLSDLRQAIMAQKKIASGAGKSNDFLLQVVNAQTKEEYKGDGTLIPRNASVIVRRVPMGASGVEDQSVSVADNHPGELAPGPSVMELSKTPDLSKAHASEEDKIEAMMNQATEDYDPSKYQRVRMAGRGAPHPNYICFKCNKPGHHIRNCPLNGLKKASGIPQTILRPAQSLFEPGVMITSTGQLVVPVVDKDAYNRLKKTTDRPPSGTAAAAGAASGMGVSKPVPAEMTCPLCREMMTDAVLIPCCGRSYCDDCIRNYLLENNFVCPETDCKQENVSPDNLIPNRMLRKTIDNFKNSKAGGSRMQDIPKEKAVMSVKEEAPEIKVEQSGKRDSTPEQDAGAGVETSRPPPSPPSALPPATMAGALATPMPYMQPARPGIAPMYPMNMYQPSMMAAAPPMAAPHMYPQPYPMPAPLPQPPAVAAAVAAAPAVAPSYAPRFPLTVDPPLRPQAPAVNPPPMSKEEFYRRQEEMRKRVDPVSRSRSGTPSTASSRSSSAASLSRSESSPSRSRSRSGSSVSSQRRSHHHHRRRHHQRHYRRRSRSPTSTKKPTSPLSSSTTRKRRRRRRRSRSRSRSPLPRRHRRRSRSRTRSRSPPPKRRVVRRNRSRSPRRRGERRRGRDRSRSPARKDRSRHGSRSRSSRATEERWRKRRAARSRSRSPKRAAKKNRRSRQKERRKSLAKKQREEEKRKRALAAVAAAEPSPDDDEVEKDQEEEEADAGASSTGGQEMTGENVDTSTGAEKSAESSSDREESDRDQGSGEESEGGSSNRKEKSSVSDNDDDESGKDVETGASNVEDAAKEDEKAASSGSDAKEKEETASTEADQDPNSVEESSASEKIPEEDEMPPPPSHAEANKIPDSRKRKVRPSAVASAGMLKAAVLGAIADAQHVRDRERHRSRHKPLVSRSGKRGSEPSLRSVVVVETGDQETESKQKRIPIKRKIPDPGKKD